MVVHICEYVKSYSVVHLTRANCMGHESHFNKAVLKGELIENEQSPKTSEIEF